MLFETLPADTLYEVEVKEGMSFWLRNVAIDLYSTEAALFISRGDKRVLITELSRAVGGTKSMNLNLEFGNCGSIVFFSKGGSIHIIGGYTKCHNENFQKIKTPQIQITHQTQNNSNQKQRNVQNPEKTHPSSESKSQTVNLPSRRSTRARAPPQPLTTKSAKRQKEHLKSMAQYFECNLDEDDDDSFSKPQENDDNESENDSSSSSSSQSEEEKPSKSRKLKSNSEKSNGTQKDEKGSKAQASESNEIKQSEIPPTFSIPTRNPYR